MGKKAKKPISNFVIVSDTHAGCGLALCPEETVLDDGGIYSPSPFQEKIRSLWDQFWGEFVPVATRNEPYSIIHNGDVIDGVHHRSTTQISHNKDVQRRMGVSLLKPLIDLCDGRMYLVRGTNAHSGESSEDEETIGREVGTIKDEDGHHARNDLWIQCGPKLIHCLHHVGTSGSQAYESTAVMKELTESYIESARWGNRPPDCIVRSHRHRNIEIKIPAEIGNAIAVVTPGWQGKTPFTWKIAGARQSQPQFGGIVIRYTDGELFVRSFVHVPKRARVE